MAFGATWQAVRGVCQRHERGTARLIVSCQVYGGKMMADVAPEGDMAIVAVSGGLVPCGSGSRLNCRDANRFACCTWMD